MKFGTGRRRVGNLVGDLKRSGGRTHHTPAVTLELREALAGIFLAGYLGMSVPVLLLGALMQFIALAPSVLGFGVFMLLLLGVTLLLLMRSRRAGI